MLFDPQLFHLKYLERKKNRNRRRFKVIKGEKNKDDDKPTYH
jgi:hypothetical protein